MAAIGNQKGETELILGLLIFSLIIIVLPALVGELFSPVYKGSGKWVFRWVSGQFLLWAGFQLIAVPLVLRQQSFGLLVLLYWFFIGALLFLTIGVYMRRKAFDLLPVASSVRKKEKKTWTPHLLWIGFWVLLAIQLIQAVRMAYADGDDAFYVSVTTTTVNAGTMYRKDAYTGLATTFDARYGLAPFPVWCAFLAKMTSLHPATMAQVALPVVLIGMTYAVFYLVGNRLFPEKNGQLPLFLIFTQLLVLYGGYSFSSSANFMLARTQQGKSVLGNVVIPFLLFLFFVLFRRLQKKEEVPAGLYLLLSVASITGCLCSSLGALLVCVFVGVAGLAGAIAYRRIRILLPLAVCVSPCLVFALVYLVLK